MICIDEGMPSFEVALLLVGIQWILSMGVHGEYPWVSGCLPGNCQLVSIGSCAASMAPFTGRGSSTHPGG